ncbi:MAG: hypothetical protein KC636_11380 [Myxococcales bacterium]|nr:hypothetical protein [Myxococcales bacterium]
MPRVHALALLGALAASSASCSNGGSDTTTDPCDGATRCPIDGAYPFEKLSDYDFFQGKMSELKPKDGVLPFEPRSPLWSDGASKARFLVLPEGTSIQFDAGDEWVYPEGAILIKNFMFEHDRRDPSAGRRIIETRLLIYQGGEWTPHVYLWDDAQEEAVQHKIGDRIDISFIDEAGAAQTQEYIVPNLDKCSSCHERDDAVQFLGPITHQLNFEVTRDGAAVNQLTWLADQGVFGGSIPAPTELPRLADPKGDAPLEDRARAYLHANCSHCHRPGGGANRSGLSFLAWEDEPLTYGVCKIPAAAGNGSGGRRYDIAPGDPDDSIVVFRMGSLDPEVKMPELPNLVIDEFGAGLVKDWIASMPVQVCGGG